MMPIYEFIMSCGHVQKKECAEPSKYFEQDMAYYKAQGLCDACWEKLHEFYDTQMARRGGD